MHSDWLRKSTFLSFHHVILCECTNNTTWPLLLPVSINETGVDVVGSFQASDWLQADACGLVGHDVDQPILELVAGEVGTDEARRVGFGVGQTLGTQKDKSGWVDESKRRKGVQGQKPGKTQEVWIERYGGGRRRQENEKREQWVRATGEELAKATGSYK